MSVQTLYTAATGMESLQTKLDVIANNLANINTTSFKADRANFEDLFYRQESYPGAEDAGGGRTAVGTHIGLGSRVSSVQGDFRQGSLSTTGRPLDIAIEGNGFFQVTDPTGETLYSRAGNFNVNAENNLVLGSAQTGRLLDPPINVPPDYTAIQVAPDGRVLVRQGTENTLQQIGQIQLATFVNPQGLVKKGENLYAATDASNAPNPGNPGEVGIGILRQGTLELSNVEPVQELIDLITTQRGFELNSQAVQAGDQVLQLIANLRR